MRVEKSKYLSEERLPIILFKFSIVFPIQRVIDNVIPNKIPFDLITDDVFIIITLP